MKNKISKLTLIACAFGLSTQLTAQKSEIKHFTVGIGAAYDPSIESLTQHTKFDYNINSKFAIGLKNNLEFWDDKSTQINEPDAMGIQTTISWRSTIFNNSSLVASYTFLGSNQDDKKFNLSAYAGLGLRYDVFREDYTHKNVPSNTYLIDRSFLKSTYYYIHSGITATYKLGPGKIFVDIPVFTDFLLVMKTNTEFDSAPSLSSENTVKYSWSTKDQNKNYLGTELGFNLGYQINF